MGGLGRAGLQLLWGLYEIKQSVLKLSSGWGLALQCWGQGSVDLGAAGVLPWRSGCNHSTAASAWGCHGLVKESRKQIS